MSGEPEQEYFADGIVETAAERRRSQRIRAPPDRLGRYVSHLPNDDTGPRKATIEPTLSRPKTSRQSVIRPRRPIAAAKNAVTSKWGNTQLQLISSLKTLMTNQFLVYQLQKGRDRRNRDGAGCGGYVHTAAIRETPH